MSDGSEDVVSGGGNALGEDPWHRSAEVEQFFGDSYPQVLAFTELLADQGVLRGLIGPRELSRLWERHILNSAAVDPFVGDGPLVDVGSGAGLPGMVLAAMNPERAVTLIEPMERRTTWLQEAVRHCGIENVTVLRGRAEEVNEAVVADTVTARAVAPIERLVKWCTPLLSDAGTMAFLKGRNAADELERAKYTVRKFGLVGSIHDAPTLSHLPSTTVVVLRRGPRG